MFTDMRIGKKLGIGFGVMAALVLIVGGLAIKSLSSFDDLFKETVDETYMKTMYPNDILNQLNVTARAVRNILLVDSKDAIMQESARIDQAAVQVNGDIDAMKKLMTTAANSSDKEKDLFKDYESSRAVYRDSMAKVKDLALAGKKQEATALLFGGFRTAQADYVKNIEAIINYEGDAMMGDGVNAGKSYTTMRNTLIGLLVAAFLVAIAMTVWIVRSIAKPISECIDVANKVAAGETDMKIDTSRRDETGELMVAMNNMVLSIRALIDDSALLSQAAIEGRLSERADASKHKGDFRKIIEGVNCIVDSIVGLLDTMPLPAMIIDKDFTVQYMNQTGATILGADQKQLVGQKCYSQFKTSDCKTDKCACTQAMNRNTEVTSETDAHPAGLNLDIKYTGKPMKNQQGAIIGAFEVVVDQTAIKQAMSVTNKVAEYQTEETRKLKDALGKMAHGDLAFDIKVSEGDGDTTLARQSFEEINGAMKQCVGALSQLVEDANMLSEAAIEGRLTTRADASKHQGDYQKIIKGVNNTLDTVVGLMDTLPIPAMIIDKDFSIRYMNQTGASMLGADQKQLVGQKCYSQFKTSDCNTDKCACGQAMNRNAAATSETDAHPAGLNLEIKYTGKPMHNQQGAIIGAFEVVVDQTAVMRAQRIANKVAEYQTEETEKLKAALGKMANGDLGFSLNVAEGDADTAHAKQSFEEISGAVGACRDNIERVVTQTKEAAAQVSQASDQIASANQNFSQKITEQAASIEETSSTMEEMSASIKQTSESAVEANKLAQGTKSLAESGSGVMDDTIKAMDEINKSSSKIANISNVIEEIAFQTNLLALNAAVEAARAGEHGKGFAVVASEIRSLAQRASQSAKEITTLIEDSVEKTGRGVQLANDLSHKLGDIGTSIKKVSDLMDEVAAAAGEQARGTSQVNTAMSQIDEATQQNASLVEETSAAAEELSAQARDLLNIVEFFKVEGATAASRPAPSASKPHAAPKPAARISHKPEPALTGAHSSSGNGGKHHDYSEFEKGSGFSEF